MGPFMHHDCHMDLHQFLLVGWLPSKTLALAHDVISCPCCELTTLWVVRLNNDAELKVTDPKEQHRDIDEEETEDEKGWDRVGC